jgi:fucose 4-O-acetylase-like acetyltransferase
MGKIKHNNSITIAKAIGIILMVVGHSGCPQLLFNFIYLFHMPLFFICSGFFFKEMTAKESAFLYLKKRIKGLYVPFLKWSVLFLLLHNFFMYIGIYNPYYGFDGGSSYYTIKEFFQKLFLIVFSMHDYEELLGGYWFLRALFISSLLIVIISLFLRKRYKFKYEAVCILFLIMTVFLRRIVPDVEFWRDISMGSLGAMFYMSGFLLKRYDYLWRNYYGAIICFISLFISFYYFRDGVSMGCGYNKVMMFSVSAVSGSLLILYLSKLIEDKEPYTTRLFYYIGNHTLEILTFHFFSFRLVSCLIVLIYNIDAAHIAEHPVIKIVQMSSTYWWILYAFFGIAFSLLIDKTLSVVTNIIIKTKI